MILTTEQTKLARHALGLPNKKRQSYRNYFCGGKNCPEWNGLVQAGYATARNSAILHDDDAYFYLTPAGAQAVLEPREKLSPEDFPSLITRPILFSAPMIRALHDGRKTQTRRLLSNKKFGVGNRLWVREAWRCNGWATDVATILYRAHERSSFTEFSEQFPNAGRRHIRSTATWKPSIHMPRWISRMTLTVTEVRQQHLQDISEEDAIAEGCGQYSSSIPLHEAFDAERKGIYREGFRETWNILNAGRRHSWGANPRVTALTFTVENHNIDQVPV